MSDDFSDIPGVIESMAEIVTLVTPAAGVLGSDGFWRPGAETTSSVNVVSWPTSGREAQKLPEGVRTRELRTFVSTVEMTGALAGTGKPAHRIRSYLGADWEVQNSWRWNIGGFWLSIASRLGAA